MKIKVTIKQDGTLDLVTQDGDFDTGKETLEALLEALNAQGVEVQQTAPAETHNHIVVTTYIDEFTANIQMNAIPSEDGLSHSH